MSLEHQELISQRERERLSQNIIALKSLLVPADSYQIAFSVQKQQDSHRYRDDDGDRKVEIQNYKTYYLKCKDFLWQDVGFEQEEGVDFLHPYFSSDKLASFDALRALVQGLSRSTRDLQEKVAQFLTPENYQQIAEILSQAEEFLQSSDFSNREAFFEYHREAREEVKKIINDAQVVLGVSPEVDTFIRRLDAEQSNFYAMRESKDVQDFLHFLKTWKTWSGYEKTLQEIEAYRSGLWRYPHEYTRSLDRSSRNCGMWVIDEQGNRVDVYETVQGNTCMKRIPKTYFVGTWRNFCSTDPNEFREEGNMTANDAQKATLAEIVLEIFRKHPSFDFPYYDFKRVLKEIQWPIDVGSISRELLVMAQKDWELTRTARERKGYGSAPAPSFTSAKVETPVVQEKTFTKLKEKEGQEFLKTVTLSYQTLSFCRMYKVDLSEKVKDEKTVKRLEGRLEKLYEQVKSFTEQVESLKIEGNVNEFRGKVNSTFSQTVSLAKEIYQILMMSGDLHEGWQIRVYEMVESINNRVVETFGQLFDEQLMDIIYKEGVKKVLLNGKTLDIQEVDDIISSAL